MEKETINIDVVRQLDGLNFSLSPSSLKKLKSIFPDAAPINSIFVNSDNYVDFKEYIGRIEDHLFPILLGISNDKTLKKRAKIRFVNPENSKTLYLVQ